MTCDQVKELLAAYAVDACDADERRFVEQHVATCCDECAEQLDRLRGAAAALGQASPSVEPPASLRNAVLDRIADATPTRQEPARRTAWRAAMYCVAATLVGVAVGAAVRALKPAAEGPSAAEVWQAQIAAAESRLGAVGTTLTALSSPEGPRLGVLYDELTGDLHFLLHARVQPKGQLWAWARNSRGEVLGSAPVQPSTQGSPVGVLRLVGPVAEFAELVVTDEPQTPAEGAPTGEVVAQARIKASR